MPLDRQAHMQFELGCRFSSGIGHSQPHSRSGQWPSCLASYTPISDHYSTAMFLHMGPHASPHVPPAPRARRPCGPARVTQRPQTPPPPPAGLLHHPAALPSQSWPPALPPPVATHRSSGTRSCPPVASKTAAHRCLRPSPRTHLCATRSLPSPSLQGCAQVSRLHCHAARRGR